MGHREGEEGFGLGMNSRKEPCYSGRDRHAVDITCIMDRDRETNRRRKRLL